MSHRGSTDEKATAFCSFHNFYKLLDHASQHNTTGHNKSETCKVGIWCVQVMSSSVITDISVSIFITFCNKKSADSDFPLAKY